MSAPSVEASNGVSVEREACDRALAAMKTAAEGIITGDPTDGNLIEMERCITRFRAERDALKERLRGLEKSMVEQSIVSAIDHARDDATTKALRTDEEFERMLRVLAAQREASASKATRLEVPCPICGCKHTTDDVAAHVLSHLAGAPTCSCPA